MLKTSKASEVVFDVFSLFRCFSSGGCFVVCSLVARLLPCKAVWGKTFPNRTPSGGPSFPMRNPVAPSYISRMTEQGLTTTRAPFIEQAQQEGRLYIEQPYELYSDRNHEAWRKLFARMQDRWARYANERFLQGLSVLALPADRVPRLEEVNQFMAPRTGFRAKPVSGYVPAFQ